MSGAETRAELIDPTLKAGNRGVVDASPFPREVIAPGRLQSVGGRSGHIHRRASIGYPMRNVACLIEDVGDHRRRPGCPSKPIAMQLEPPKPISRQLRIGPRMCQPGTRIGRNPHHRRVVCLNQPPGGIWPRGPMRHGLKIASDHAQILLPGGVGDQDRQRRSCSLRARLALGASAGFLKRLEQTPCLALRCTGIANTARREVARAGIQPIGQRSRSLPADLLVHGSRHPCHLVSARYHIQGPVQNNRFTQQSSPRPSSPLHLPSPEIAA